MSMKLLRQATIVTAATLLTAPLAWADLAFYAQDFESLDAQSPSALGDVGWKVFANVFDPSGTNFLYGYGVFPAPNLSGGFSNVAVEQGGPDQGEQQLVTFSDYNNGDQEIGNRIEANVFVEQSIGAVDIGSDYVFAFDAKKGDIAGASTAIAFIKTLDPNAGFAVTNFLTIDTTALPETWANYSLSMSIDADLAGQLLQFGFATVASNFEASGVLYDNVVFGMPVGMIDTDGDGVDDSLDNCTLIANSDQRDTNGDGFGNACDADLNNDGTINIVDLGLLRSVFFSNNADADFNGDGTVNIVDLGILRVSFFGMPGPAAPSL